MRKAILAVIVISLFACTAFADGISVNVNGDKLDFDTEPVMTNDRVLVPMRAIFEKLDADVLWDDATRQITAKKDGKTIVLQIDNPIMTANGETISLDVPPMLSGDRTLVPVRAVSEALNTYVSWDNNTQTVNIISRGGVLETKSLSDMVYEGSLPIGSITAYYPVVYGSDETTSLINASLEKTAAQYIEACKSRPYYNSKKVFVCEQSCSYNIVGNALSVLYTDYEEYDNQIIITHYSENYSLETGQLMGLEEIFNISYGEIMTMLIESYMTEIYSNAEAYLPSSIDLMQEYIESTSLYLDDNEAVFILDSVLVSPSTVDVLTHTVPYESSSMFSIKVK